MSEHIATVEWQLTGEFRYETYSRAHTVDFGRGVRLAGNAAEEHAKLHEKAHQRCFIANSVKTRIILEPGIA